MLFEKIGQDYKLVNCMFIGTKAAITRCQNFCSPGCVLSQNFTYYAIRPNSKPVKEVSGKTMALFNEYEI